MDVSLLCSDAVPANFAYFDFSVAPPLMLYSYIPAIVVSLLIGIYVMMRSNFSLPSKLLLFITISFSLWVSNYVFQWTIAYVHPDMFSWVLGALLILPFYYLTLYFVYVFLYKKDSSFVSKLFFSLTVLPVLFLMPTRYNMLLFDASMCEGEIGLLWYYIYTIELVIILSIIFIGVKRYLQEKDRKSKIITATLTLGSTIFLLLAWLSDVLGELTRYYQLNFIGPVGLFIFIGLLAYLIVQFKVLNIKLLAAQVLVVALVILIGSQFFFIQNPTNIILNGITLALSIVFGYMLVRSVNLEVRRKEELENLSKLLAAANDKLHVLDKAKSEFISIASHQLRTPLTSIKGFGSLLLEGTYGALSEVQKNALEKIYIANERLIHLVEDLLNISRIEAGRMEFDFQEVQIEDLVREVVDTLELAAKAKKLHLDWQKPAQPLRKVSADATKIKEVISNMVDNAIKYTQKGSVTVRTECGSYFDHDSKEQKSVVRVIVSDTGIGMDKQEIKEIFQKFQRGKQVSHYHTEGTGLGMYVGRKIVAAHKGSLWAESEGRDKGSKFTLELPIKIV